MIRSYLQNQRGAAAVEFAVVVGMFTLALPSVIDIGIYAYDAMQVKNAAQMGVQAIWAACSQLPATDTTNSCPTAQAAMNAAVTRTSLSNSVSVSTVSEGYYCTDSTGALANAVSGTNNTGDFTTALNASSKVPTPPTNCNVLTNPKTAKPGDYIWVSVTYTYTPVFARVSAANLLGTPCGTNNSQRCILSTAWMRLI